MKKLQVFILVILFSSCSSTKVYMDYDANADLPNYKTYDYFLIEENGFNELDVKRVKKAIDYYLKEKNITPEAIPDFSINFYAETYTVESQNNIGVGVGGGNRGFGGGISSGIPINTSKDMIAFTVEFVDALTKELFWQCVVETKIEPTDNPTERQNFINDMVSQALAKYPPDADKKAK
jgi:hypothetical protein